MNGRDGEETGLNGAAGPAGPVISRGEAEERLAALREGILDPCRTAGRDPSEVSILAVSKTFPAESVDNYVLAGQRDFGESYVKEARDKIPLVKGKAVWHYIGHLQTNKAKHAVNLFTVIHALDSLDLAAELNKRLIAMGSTMDVYVQVNVSGEDSKSGIEPEEFPNFLDALRAYAALVPVGLMTMPPWDPDPEVSRPHFRKLRELRDKHAPDLKGLSMGMSGDHRVAIEEGSTMVRIGTALFGERTRP
jgi:pyridoxal phosphate enzyme (YggS family)